MENHNRHVDYSVVIPAYNEELHLAGTLDSLRQAMDSYTSLAGEVIVVDNNSNDATPDIAREHNACVVFEGYNQISRARNRGAEAASGRYLLFLDADTNISQKIFKTALDCLDSQKYYGGGVKVCFGEGMPLFVKCLTGIWNGLAGKHKMAAGCFIFCLNSAFKDVGGFREDVYAGEEVFLSRKLAKWGKRNNMDFHLVTSEPISTSARKMHMYSSAKLLSTMFILGLCPFLLRSKKICSIWYER